MDRIPVLDYKKMRSIFKGLQSIKQYLVKAGMSTPRTVAQLKQPITGFKYYQSCADRMIGLIHDVCYREATPNAKKVFPLSC